MSYGTRLRAAEPELDRRFVDVSYLDLVADPVGVVENLYRHSAGHSTATRVPRWHAGQTSRREAEPRQRYALSDNGLTGNQVDDAFADYLEFTKANKIRMR